MTEMTQQQREAIEALDQRFSSGNDTPVSQSRITRKEWQAIRAAFAGTPVPEGWQLVPVNPTPAQLEAMRDAFDTYAANPEAGPNWKRRVYRAMLAAAPDPKDNAGD